MGLFSKKQTEISPEKAEPLVFSRYYFAEHHPENYRQQWEIYHTASAADPKIEDSDVFYCWTRQDAILLMAKFDEVAPQCADTNK